MDRKTHWETVYTQKNPTEVSWYQEDPAVSLALIRSADMSKAARIIDVGGGASTLVDHLIQQSFENVAVLDLSAAALEKAKQRLGALAAKVTWLEQDVTTFTSPQLFDLWHDRAVFHFLTDVNDRNRYIEVLKASLVPHGHVIMATFANDGPNKCSGLEVCRYSAESLQETLGASFHLVETRYETHHTPWNSEQRFIYAYFRN
jgi:trans-aconitate methyltransferase